MNDIQPPENLLPTHANWHPAPERLMPAPGQVNILRLALDLPQALNAQLASLLSADEQARAARFHFDSDRLHFTSARGQLRCILAACLQITPQAVMFVYNPHGKPAQVNAPDLHFNLSHSSGLGLLALSTGQAVGIDIESIRPAVDRDNIARRFFAPAEVAALHALPAEQQEQAFFTCWTRKEAYIKARGLGLSIPLGQFVVSLAPGEPARLLAREPGAPAGQYAMAAIDPGPGQVAAVAVEGRLASLQLWDWQESRV
jgi:4'-phosphopantetheinyl transferase